MNQQTSAIDVSYYKSILVSQEQEQAQEQEQKQEQPIHNNPHISTFCYM